MPGQPAPVKRARKKKEPSEIRAEMQPVIAAFNRICGQAGFPTYELPPDPSGPTIGDLTRAAKDLARFEELCQLAVKHPYWSQQRPTLLSLLQPRVRDLILADRGRNQAPVQAGPYQYGYGHNERHKAEVERNAREWEANHGGT